MSGLFYLAIIVALPIIAAKGYFYRGAWFGISALALMLSIGSCLASIQTESKTVQIKPAWMDQETFQYIKAACAKERKREKQPFRQEAASFCDQLQDLKQKANEKLNRTQEQENYSEPLAAVFVGSFLAGCFYRPKRN